MSESGKLRAIDVTEILVGSCVLAFPVATTADIWELSKSLPDFRVFLLAVGSWFFLALFAYAMHFGSNIKGRMGEFIWRTISLYLLTIIVCAAILLVIDKLPVTDNPVVALKRCVLVAFAASFSATVVDSLG